MQDRRRGRPNLLSRRLVTLDLAMVATDGIHA